jgi:IS605 OrfB family transposase
MITRQTKHTLKFSNKNKLTDIDLCMDMYKHDLQLYVNAILDGRLPFVKLVSKPYVDGTLIKQSHWKQILYKEASQIISSKMSNLKKQVYKKYQKLYAKSKQQNKYKFFTDKHFKELKINYFKRIKININSVSIPLDYRTFDIIDTDGYFNQFVRITLPIEYKTKNGVTRYKKVKIPIKQYSHSLKYSNWQRCNTICLQRNHVGQLSISLIYEKKEQIKKEHGETVGIDLGYNKLITTSNGITYGEHLKPIYQKLANKKRGSKNYNQLLQHKKCEINHIINEFVKEQNIYQLYCEDLKELRKASKMSTKELNKQQYFTYAQVLTKLDSMAQTEGFYLTKVNPAYTSQTCSNCGDIDKSNRQGEIYQCKSCGMIMDADINAAINILHRGAYSSSTTQNNCIEIIQ